MSISTQVEKSQDSGSAGISRGEPGGRAQRNASGRDAGRPSRVDDLPNRVRELLPDGVVVDELLAGACSEEEIGWSAFAVDEAAGGASDGSPTTSGMSSSWSRPAARGTPATGARRRQ
jgi:hypothetical protein